MATVGRVGAQAEVEDDVVLLAPEEETVPEHDVHRVMVDLLAAGLVARFAGAQDVAVFSRLAWFPDRSNTRIRLDPDVMVVRGRPPGPRKSFKDWMEDGVVPSVVVEVWSDEDTDADYRRRLGRMHTYGVPEVVIVDPFAPGGVRVEHLRLHGDGYRVVGSSSSSDRPLVIESLGVTLAGGPELEVREDGRRWPTTAEAFRMAWVEADRADAEARRADVEAGRADAEGRRADAEAGRADAEGRRADAEAGRADAEAQRAERLAARLRAAGIDPEA